MLILTRKVGQGFVISGHDVPGDIVVSVLGLHRGRVKLGVAAPPGVVVLREEVLEKKPRAPGAEEKPAGPA